MAVSDKQALSEPKNTKVCKTKDRGLDAVWVCASEGQSMLLHHKSSIIGFDSAKDGDGLRYLEFEGLDWTTVAPNTIGEIE
ncbi:hypothetical protein BGX28_007416 [Mortierella sp. GBA30]|nr:hypothetical protein BGX28_007416 [Mortierella sp. GBA30]